jgi:hypothetical protein
MGHASSTVRPYPDSTPVAFRLRDGGERAMHDRVDQRLHDIVALDEIDLYAEVLTAVAATDRPLTPAELDQVLGLPDMLDVPSATVAGLRVG